jgi:Co/Zn/Cd efflux system component
LSDHCCSCNAASPAAEDPRYRRALWFALVVNVVMFVVEVIGGAHAGSVSLLADAIDFFGDAVNYATSLAVLVLASVWRSRTAFAKGLCMGAFGIFVIGRMLWSVSDGVVPEPKTMGTIAFFALLANVSAAFALYAFRTGDANMRSVWLCSRNDAINNIAVMLAALGVFGTATAWPDWIVATLMGLLGLSSAVAVIRHARSELVEAKAGRH